MLDVRRTRRAAMLTDTLVGSFAIFVVLALVMGGARGVVSPQRQDVGCLANLMAYGSALAACRTDNNGFSPYFDDGSDSGPYRIMLSWADLLADEGYVAVTQQRCPSDLHPDYPANQRGIQWDFRFVDQFGVGETPRRGVRSSYAVNSVVAFNWPEDRFADASRQIDVADGWWTWHGSVTAYWSVAMFVTGYQPGIISQTWQDTMVGYRHNTRRANMLMLDGSVKPVEPRVPRTSLELRYAVDTEQTFTWLPGEVNGRLDNERYHGTHIEYNNRWPALYDSATSGWRVNPALPNHLQPSWRSVNNAWITLPNPAERY